MAHSSKLAVVSICRVSLSRLAKCNFEQGFYRAEQDARSLLCTAGEKLSEALDWFHKEGFREDLTPDDLRNLEFRPQFRHRRSANYILDADRNIIEFNCESLD